MSMVVQHNMQAANANRMLGVTTSAQAKSTEKLSSGYRINRAADDAAGLTISEKMRKQIKGLDKASSNAEDGVSAVQTAEGALTEVHGMLQRMNELATQAANGTNSESDRQAIQDEISQLTTEIDRVAETTKFNETYLLRGDAQGITKTNTIAAHDAGLDGKLVDNENGTSTFTADALKVGDTVSIGGKEYTIGDSAKTADYIAPADYTAAAGDVVTKADGTTTKIVEDVDLASAKAAAWANGDSFTASDGTTYTIVNSGASGNNILASDVASKLDAGSVITKNAALKVGTTTGDVASTVKVVDALGDNEISITDSTNVTALETGLAAGDKVTTGGTTKTVTDYKAATLDDISADTNLVDGASVKINGTAYEIGVANDPTATTPVITKDDFLQMIKDGDHVEVDDGAGAYTDYTALIKAADEDTITVSEAYEKMAEELQKASSIGTDTAATVKNNGDGTFDITQGTVEVKDKLSFSLHVGADADMTNKINVDIESMSAAGLGIKGISIMDTAADENGVAATYAIDAIADAIAKVSSQRSSLGAIQNRLEHTIDNLDNISENTTSAESRIRDTDMATEMVNYSKTNILAQAGQSMLAQANQSNQGVLSLLG